MDVPDTTSAADDTVQIISHGHSYRHSLMTKTHGQMDSSKEQTKHVTAAFTKSGSALLQCNPPLTLLSQPVFLPPLQYVKVFTAEAAPFVEHNHDPSVVVCPNDDVYAIWFSTIEETGRESSIVQSWLRNGTNRWELASIYMNTPDRMENAPLMWVDERGTLIGFWASPEILRCFACFSWC